MTCDMKDFSLAPGGHSDKYLLLTEFEGHTVNYSPRFSPSIYGPSALAGYKSKGKNKGL